jgi:beta-fructofuranosidase
MSLKDEPPSPFVPEGLEGANTPPPSYANGAEKFCGIKGIDVMGGVGPFGLWVLASANM